MEVEHRPSRFFGVERLFQDRWPGMAREVLTGPLLRGEAGQPLTREEIMQLPTEQVAEISDALGLRLKKSSETWTNKYRVTRPTPLGRQALITRIAAGTGGEALRKAIAELREGMLLQQQRQQQPLEIYKDTLEIQPHRSKGLSRLLQLLIFDGRRFGSPKDPQEEAQRNMSALSRKEDQA